jgi:hypothetical protein
MACSVSGARTFCHDAFIRMLMPCSLAREGCLVGGVDFYGMRKVHHGCSPPRCTTWPCRRTSKVSTQTGMHSPRAVTALFEGRVREHSLCWTQDKSDGYGQTHKNSRCLAHASVVLACTLHAGIQCCRHSHRCIRRLTLVATHIALSSYASKVCLTQHACRASHSATGLACKASGIGAAGDAASADAPMTCGWQADPLAG